MHTADQVKQACITIALHTAEHFYWLYVLACYVRAGVYMHVHVSLVFYCPATN